MPRSWNGRSDEEKAQIEQLFEALHVFDRLTDSAGGGVRRFGFNDLFAVATDPDAELSDELAEALRTDAKLERDFDALLDRYAACRIPQAAAADSGTSAPREFDAYRLSVRQSSAGRPISYVLIEILDQGSRRAPQQIVVRPQDGRPVKRRLPEPVDGTIRLIVDNDDPLLSAIESADTIDLV